MSEVRVALIQMKVSSEKSENLQKASRMIAEAAGKGAQLICLPECFNSPYDTKCFPIYAEEIPGESTSILSKAAKDHSVYILGGSIPEKDDGKLYNTCTVWGPNGELLGKHRKVHLFDVEVEGGITCMESDCLSPGNQFTTFDMPQCRVGVGVCYDYRFAEMGLIYADMGCKLIVYPGAFNMSTGPPHLETLMKARALDNQVYVACVSPAKNVEASYDTYGFTALVSPWAEIVNKVENTEDIVFGVLDMDYVCKIRGMMPIRKQRRTDMYEVVNLKTIILG